MYSFSIMLINAMQNKVHELSCARELSYNDRFYEICTYNIGWWPICRHTINLISSYLTVDVHEPMSLQPKKCQILNYIDFSHREEETNSITQKNIKWMIIESLWITFELAHVQKTIWCTNRNEKTKTGACARSRL